MSENEAVNLLLRDSVRLAILARDLTEQEKQSITQRNAHLVPRVQKLAIDGIAIIVHKNNPDTLISVETLQKIMTGGITSWRALNPAAKQDKMVVVFDHPASSTVRFIKDSICKGEPLSEN
jgi:phosphate transport system substrate-binding protein